MIDDNQYNEVFIKVIAKYGERHNIMMLIEEMAELTHAILYSLRAPSKEYANKKVLDALADVYICLGTFRFLMQLNTSTNQLSTEEFDQILNDTIKNKIERLKERMEIEQ